MRTLIVILGLLGAAPAWARCAGPRPFFSPPSGGAVPADALVYYFDLTDARSNVPLEVSARDEHGADIPTTVTLVTEAPSFRAFATRLRAGAAREVRLHAASGRASRGQTADALYSVSASWV